MKLKLVQTKQHADPKQFWDTASDLAVDLANEGPKRSKDPLTWLAALEITKEALLAMGGAALAEDWRKAQAGRRVLEQRGHKFGIEVDDEAPS